MAPRVVAALLALALLMPVVGYAQSVRIELQDSGAGYTIDVLGLDDETLTAVPQLPAEQREQLLRVSVDGAADAPPLGGILSVVEKSLRFTPRYPLEPGLSFRATFNPALLSKDGKGGKVVSAVLPLAARKSDPTTVVQQIYPTAAVLPENQRVPCSRRVSMLSLRDSTSD